MGTTLARRKVRATARGASKPTLKWSYLLLHCKSLDMVMAPRNMGKNGNQEASNSSSCSIECSLEMGKKISTKFRLNFHFFFFLITCTSSENYMGHLSNPFFLSQLNCYMKSTDEGHWTKPVELLCKYRTRFLLLLMTLSNSLSL